jgi:DNA (cytosine-5)-methyltransferase 1
MSPLLYGSVCSGIEAASVAWEPLGWRAAFFSEIEAFPRAVLHHHYPAVPLHGDFTTIRAGDYEPIDLLVGGTPCQDFSVAGLRAGFAGERGNLTREFVRLAERLRPRWLVWENVPGILSIDEGRAFGSFLGGLAERGYGFAYRILDAQHFGIPQRRRRVFVIGYPGDWRPAAAVLFERHSLQGHFAPGREARAPVAALTSSGVGTCGADDNQAQGGHLIASTGETAHCLNAGGMGRQDYETETLITHTLRGDGFDASEDGTGRGTPLVPVAVNLRGRAGGAMPELSEMASLRAASGGSSRSYVATAIQEIGKRTGTSTDDPRAGIGIAAPGAPMFTLQAGAQHGIQHDMAVRRLTPRECERLQGFPDDYTLVPYRGKPAADGPRYKALGNSMAVPVMRWIGGRIEMVEKIHAQAVAE